MKHTARIVTSTALLSAERERNEEMALANVVVNSVVVLYLTEGSVR